MTSLNPEQLQIIRESARDDASYAALVQLFDQHSTQLLDSLHQQEARYHAVVDQQTEFVCRYLPDTTLTFVNDAYCRFHNKREDELVGQKFLLLLAPESREPVWKSIQGYIESPDVSVYESLTQRRQGDQRLIQWVRRPIFDDQGHLIEIQAVGRDITDQRRIETALNRNVESNRRSGQKES